MKKSVFIISIISYIVSALMLFLDYPGVFAGFWILGMFVNEIKVANAFALAIFVIITLLTVLTLKYKNLIFVVRGLLVAITVMNLLTTFLNPEHLPLLLISIALLVISFFEENEIIITNTVTAEELENIKKEQAEEKTKSIIGNVVAFTVVPFVVLILTIIVLAIIPNESFENLKADYRNEMPTEYVSESIAENFNINNYEMLSSNWHIDYEVTEKINRTDGSHDYWTLNGTDNIVLEAFYDDWDMSVDEDIYIKKDYKFPDTTKSKVSKIVFSYNYFYTDEVICDFTEEEMSILRDLVINENFKEEDTRYFSKEELNESEKRWIFWQFENEENFYWQQGYLIRFETGEYYIRVDSSYYTLCKIPKSMHEKIEKLFADKEF